MYTSGHFSHRNSPVERRFLRILKLISDVMQNDFQKCHGTKNLLLHVTENAIGEIFSVLECFVTEKVMN